MPSKIIDISLQARYRFFRKIALFLCAVLVMEVILPPLAHALTSGPTSPEVSAFTPVGTDNLVDLFTGDLTYNIPLFELPGPNGGYPFNLAYNSGITMDQEASWVGLGWSLNPGAINRNMRGFPDEFKGDPIQITRDMKANITYGGSVGANFQLFGADASVGFGLAPGIKVYNNSYKGVGYGISLGADVRNQTGNDDSQDEFSAGIGLNLSLDSQEGAGVSPSLSLSKTAGSNRKSLNFGLSVNSWTGLNNLSLGLGGSHEKFSKKRNRDVRHGIGGSSTLSFATRAYTPYSPLAFEGFNTSFSIKYGPGGNGPFAGVNLLGFYTQQKLAHAGNPQPYPTFGYLHLEHAGEDGLMDFNREKDGMVRETSPNLASPSLTYDIFTIQGQGTGGMFRAYRNNFGVVHDPTIESKSMGPNVGVEIGPPGHNGVDIGFNYSATVSGMWKNGNGLSYTFDPVTNAIDHEKYYFKVHGEPTSRPQDEIARKAGGVSPYRVSLQQVGSGLNKDFFAIDQLAHGASSLTPTQPPTAERQPRNQVVRAVLNKEVASGNPLGEYAVSYFTNRNAPYNGPGNTPTSLPRPYPDHHFAGMTVFQTDGSQYVYGLPAYNKKSVEMQFSVDGSNVNCEPTLPILDNDNDGIPDYKVGVAGSDQYLERKETPAYPYAWMLTSILGHDYRDIDDIPGPSDGDFGYWVKFEYVKVEDNYKWRAPFLGANFIEGSETVAKDDKGSYLYGEKEIWHLATVQTKTHIAEFTISPRKDARGANKEIQNPSTNGNAVLGGFSYQLDEISLYSKAERISPSGINASATPITTVHFEYDHSLCQGVQNNLNSYNGNPQESGKLTLKKVWFTHESSTRGAKSPYEFSYDKGGNFDNPGYQTHAQDRWGMFKPIDPNHPCRAIDYPYTDQGDSLERQQVDQYSGAWNLKQVALPSGGRLNIEYEADDYAHVQNKAAMRMFRVVSLRSAANANENKIDHPRAFSGHNNDRRVYFELEKPIPQNDPAYIDRYFKGIDLLYYKVKINLREPSQSGQGFFEYINGYSEIEGYGMDQSSIVGGNYTRGYVQLRRTKIGSFRRPYHPFSVAAWQYLRTNRQELVSPIPMAGAGTSQADQIAAIRALNPLTLMGQMAVIFTGFFDYCFDKDWGEEIKLEDSFIRLNDPDHIKFGGGSRVKKVTLNDNWEGDGLGYQQEFGTVYDYSITENGERFTSGVASYEPIVGGDENPWRTAKIYTENIPLKTDNNLFFETPVNESYFPGPTIGYRKVTVKSLATEKVLGGLLSSTVPTTGAAVHEFWTSKDFPVITDETHADIRTKKAFVPIPLIGQIQKTELTASQGYCIQLNDMHGKQKKVSNYKHGDDGKILWEDPVSWVEYNYQYNTLYPNTNRQYHVLSNKVDVVHFDVDPNDRTHSDFDRKEMGVEYEQFADMRESVTQSNSVGLALNVDWVGPIPVPPVWPAFSENTSSVRTAVVNKVIHRAGILTGMTAYNEGSYVYTDYKLFDGQTGQPRLTTVTNDYNDPIFSYDYPAFWAYEGMGTAYKNSGLAFPVNLSPVTGSQGQFVHPGTLLGGQADRLLVPGDELVFLPSTGPNQKAIYLGKSQTANEYHFYFANPPGSPSGEMRVVRSGRRNHLNVSAQQITALKDPTRDRLTAECYRDLATPGLDIDSTYTLTVAWSDTLLDPCTTGLISLLNSYLQTTAYPNPVSIPSLNPSDFCFDCEGLIRSNGSPYAFFNFTGCPDGDCDLYLFDGNGNQYPKQNLVSISNPRFVATAPFTPSITFLFDNMAVDLAYTGVASPLVGYVFRSDKSNCTLPWSVSSGTRIETRTVLTDSSGQHTLTDTLYLIDSVLSATTSTFNDAWTYDLSDARFSENPVRNSQRLNRADAFERGERGIWRLWQSYVYVDERDQSPNLDLREDGTFSQVPVFNFQNLIFDYCAGKWTLENEVTRYSPYSYELENRDVLEVHSAALYGYGGQWPIAVARNAQYREIGFESFEEYAPGATIGPDQTSTGNIDCYNSYPGGFVPPTIYQFRDILFGRGNNVSFVDSVDNTLQGSSVAIKARSEGQLFDPAVSYAGNRQVINTAPTSLSLNTEPWLHLKPTNGYWRGRLGWPPVPWQPVSGNANLPNLQYSDAKAHTGKMSAKITGQVTLPQNRLILHEGKKMTLQAWVSRDNTVVPSYRSGASGMTDRLAIKAVFTDRGNSPIGTPVWMEPLGRLVEGWQKIEADFEIPPGAKKMELTFQSGSLNGTVLPAYFDDIRIQPFKSAMTCYVYDTGDWRLRSVLDDDNFATVYHYDEAGNLHLVQKETVEGLRTIQESRTFMKETR